jgi:GTP-binding protein
MATSHTARFIAAAPSIDRIPRDSLAEIAVAGRSNVGKSSLLNRLTGQSKLARVSKTPGRTQQINFFTVDESFILADLPGYGFAQVPLAMKAQWKILVETYLTNRASLRGVVVLVDMRRGFAEDDEQLLQFLGAHGIATVVAGTKVDKLNQGERLRQTRGLLETAAHCGSTAVICSSVTGQGIDALWESIHRLLRGRNTTHFGQ